MGAAQAIEIHTGARDPIERLRTLGQPDSFAPDEWPDYPALYGFDASHIPGLIALATDPDLLTADQDAGPEAYGPMLAWRVLGQLRAEAAIAPLLGLLRKDDADDGVCEDLPFVFALIGPPAIPAVAAFAADPALSDFRAGVATDALVKIAEYHPAYREDCVACLMHLLVPETQTPSDAPTWAVAALLDLHAVESIDAIRAAFTRHVIDLSIVGDLEDVEIALGLREKRDTPKPRYRPNFMDMSTWRRSSLDNQEWDDPDEWCVLEPVRLEPKIGRNEPCPCGSGKKYKKCCLG